MSFLLGNTKLSEKSIDNCSLDELMRKRDLHLKCINLIDQKIKGYGLTPNIKPSQTPIINTNTNTNKNKKKIIKKNTTVPVLPPVTKNTSKTITKTIPVKKNTKTINNKNNNKNITIDNCTMKEMKAVLTANGIPFKSNPKKSDLIDLLRNKGLLRLAIQYHKNIKGL